jgi:hypothetical protein
VSKPRVRKAGLCSRSHNWVAMGVTAGATHYQPTHYECTKCEGRSNACQICGARITTGYGHTGPCETCQYQEASNG